VGYLSHWPLGGQLPNQLLPRAARRGGAPAAGIWGYAYVEGRRPGAPRVASDKPPNLPLRGEVVTKTQKLRPTSNCNTTSKLGCHIRPGRTGPRSAFCQPLFHFGAFCRTTDPRVELSDPGRTGPRSAFCQTLSIMSHDVETGARSAFCQPLFHQHGHET
jgi:hypothetical protein